MNASKTTVADIVNQNPQAATVFKKYKIDFCCQGKKALDEACTNAGVKKDDLLSEIDQLTRQPGSFLRIHSWSPAMICDYIYHNHHQYIRKVLPEINAISQKVARVHGQNHPELIELRDTFLNLSKDLLLHLDKEEEELFPAIKAGKLDQELVEEIEHEHLDAGEAMARIHELSSGYHAPADACTSYRILFELLKEFEDDLHQHVHIENNILMVKATGNQ